MFDPNNKELSNYLPSGILSEMEMDTEVSQDYIDNDDEIVDVIITTPLNHFP